MEVQLPQQLIDSLRNAAGFDETAFIETHSRAEQITSIRINPLKELDISATAWQYSRVPWSHYGYYLNERPSFTFDPLFHAGSYYVQEASSMFLEQAIKQTVDLSAPLKVLDLSAAPGGKSTHLQSLISKDSLLVSNEVIRSRANILKDNIIKWGSNNVVVTNNDPRDFIRLPDYFDVIVVDAPCSGSGLFRRDPEAIEEWSLQNVALCSQRQQRILADVLPALKPGGILIYSTCSYSTQEDEDIINWLLKELPIANCPLLIDSSWNIVQSEGGYRFWPDKAKGEGFFLSCFKKEGQATSNSYKIKTKAETLTRKESEIVYKWMEEDCWNLIKHQQTVYAWPTNLSQDFNLLLNQLRVIYSGTIIGELMREKLVPDHALAMSPEVSEKIPRIDLKYDQAIQYLQRKELVIDAAEKGWQLVTYLGHSLGWVNVLPNRINNYYPKELRILKDKQD